MTRTALPALHRIAALLLLALLPSCSSGGPKPRPPREVLAPPQAYPATWQQRQLTHTPNGYIYAASPDSAGEADQVIAEVRDYIRRHHRAALDKLVVVVMEPGDEPFCRTLEEVDRLERDPAIVRSPPTHKKPISEARADLEKNGVPESAFVEAATLPLTPRMLADRGLRVPADAWGVAMPAHALTLRSAEAMIEGSLRKNHPDAKPADLARAKSWLGGIMAKSFKLSRPAAVFTLWAQRQADWSDAQRRDAIRAYMRRLFRANGLPEPKDEDIGY